MELRFSSHKELGLLKVSLIFFKKKKKELGKPKSKPQTRQFRHDKICDTMLGGDWIKFHHRHPSHDGFLTTLHEMAKHTDIDCHIFHLKVKEDLIKNLYVSSAN